MAPRHLVRLHRDAGGDADPLRNRGAPEELSEPFLVARLGRGRLWLAEIGVEAGGEAAHAIFRPGIGRERNGHDRRARFARPDAAQQRKPVSGLACS